MSQDQIKLVSINIEGSKHLDLVIPFLQRENPDVICVQEIFMSDIPLFESKLGMKSFFAAGCLWDQDGAKPEMDPFGECIFTKEDLQNISTRYYVGDPSSLPLHIRGKSETVYHALISGEIYGFMVGTTHFVWTPKGEADERQREAVSKFLEVAKEREEIVFTGDFNAPRGQEIFSAISRKYKDNIPKEYETSIDGSMHRSGPLPYMVDGLFTTPGYIAENVRLEGGVSDHMAVIATIRRA